MPAGIGVELDEPLFSPEQELATFSDLPLRLEETWLVTDDGDCLRLHVLVRAVVVDVDAHSKMEPGQHFIGADVRA